MTRWGVFLAGTSLLVSVTVALAWLTARSMRDRQRELSPDRWGVPESVIGVSRNSLYLNAAASQGLLLATTAGLLFLTGVDAGDLYFPGTLEVPIAVAVGITIGGLLALFNLGMQAVFDRLGIAYDDSLQELLTPTSIREWVVLLVVVLPIVAGFEELLFRGVLIGGISAGYGVSPWLLAIPSSIVFAAGHGLQGRGGLLAAGLLGLALSIPFIITESIVVVVVAHYVINVIEFARHR